MRYLVAIAVLLSSVVAGLSMAGPQEATREKTGESKTQRTRSQASTVESVTPDSAASPTKTPQQPEKVLRSNQEWRKLLTREEFRVLRMKGTERPFRNKFDRQFEAGTYVCAACGQELFSSDTKFNSGCGWPAFYASLAGDRVVLTPDTSLGMVRTEVTCARCDSHLGHIFHDAPQTPTGQRYCINSVSLKFIPAETPGGRTNSDEIRSDKSAAEKSPQRGKRSAQDPKASRS